MTEKSIGIGRPIRRLTNMPCTARVIPGQTRQTGKDCILPSARGLEIDLGLTLGLLCARILHLVLEDIVIILIFIMTIVSTATFPLTTITPSDLVPAPAPAPVAESDVHNIINPWILTELLCKETEREVVEIDVTIHPMRGETTIESSLGIVLSTIEIVPIEDNANNTVNFKTYKPAVGHSLLLGILEGYDPIRSDGSAQCPVH